MYCIYCGAKIDDDAKFCTECGKKQLQDTPVVEEKASTVSSQASLVSKVLAELHDSDIIAADTKGEMRCPSSAAQTAFMRLIAKGILTLLCLFLLPLGAFAQNTFNVNIPTPAGTMDATCTFEGRPIKWYWREGYSSFDEERVFNAYGMQLHKGDKLTVRVTVQRAPGNDYFFLYEPTISASDKGYGFTSTEFEYGDAEGYRNTGFYKMGAIVTVLEEPKDTNYSIRVSLGTLWFPNASGLKKHGPQINLYILGNKGPNGECQDDAVTELSETEEEAEADVTIDTMASSVEDEEAEQSWVIPAAIAGAVAVGAGGIAASRRSRKKKKQKKSQKKEDKQQDEEQKEDDDPDKCTYEMRIRKDFGDTLYPGDANHKIYARIVKIDSRGNETTDYALTQRISISADDNLEVSSQQMAGDYMGAFIRAHATKTPAAEAIVTFRLATQGGSFCNRMHINIAQQMITFSEDELTIPAGFEKSIYLPFEVDGMGEAPTVKAKITGDKYSVKVEYDKEGELYYAVITDKSREPGTPGDVKYYTLTVTATDSNQRQIENTISVGRFTMGLACNGLERVKCYLEEYDSKRHVFSNLQRSVKMDTATNFADDPKYVTKTMTPAENRFKLSLYEYDEEERRIICIPPNITNYNVIIDEEPPIMPETGNALSQAGMMVGGVLPAGVGTAMNTAIATGVGKQNAGYNDRSKTVQGLGLHIDAKKGFNEKDRKETELVCYMVCRGGILDAPNRLHARIIIEAENDGRKYYVEQRVLLISQPYRKVTMTGYDQLVEHENQITTALERVRSDIYHNFYKDLHLLSLLIERMLSNYSRSYGYDWQQVRGVFRIFNRYVQGQQLIDNMAAEDLSVCITDAVARVLTQSKNLEKHLGIFGRFIVGVCTLGVSEGVFNSLEVVHNMKDYVDKGGDSVFCGFMLGTKVAVREYLYGLLFAKGLKAVKNIIKNKKLTIGKSAEAVTPGKAGKPGASTSPSKTPSAAATAASEEASRKTAKEFASEAADTAKSARTTKAAHEKAQLRNTQGKQSAQKMANETKDLAMDNETRKLLDAEESGLRAGQEKIEKLKELCQLPDTPKNRQRRIEAVLEVQKDKNALNLLNNPNKPELTQLRKQFNSDMKKVHYSAEFDMKMDLADQLNKNPRNRGRKFIANDIESFNATSNGKAALENGSKSAMDYDGSFYIKGKNNEKIFLDQDMVENTFQQHLYRKGTGKEGTAQTWKEFAEATDHTIIQNDLHHDSYGTDNVFVLLDPSRAAEALPDVERAARAFTEKCTHWYKDALQLIGKGDLKSIERGVAHIREAFRQCTKQFDNFVIVRDAARQHINGGSKVSDQMFTLINYLKETDVNKGSLKVGECLNGLENMGVSPVAIFQELGNCIRNIG